jgi:hypothetical protein
MDFIPPIWAIGPFEAIKNPYSFGQDTGPPGTAKNFSNPWLAKRGRAVSIAAVNDETFAAAAMPEKTTGE